MTLLYPLEKWRVLYFKLLHFVKHHFKSVTVKLLFPFKSFHLQKWIYTCLPICLYPLIYLYMSLFIYFSTIYPLTHISVMNDWLTYRKPDKLKDERTTLCMLDMGVYLWNIQGNWHLIPWGRWSCYSISLHQVSSEMLFVFLCVFYESKLAIH